MHVTRVQRLIEFRCSRSTLRTMCFQLINSARTSQGGAVRAFYFFLTVARAPLLPTGWGGEVLGGRPPQDCCREGVHCAGCATSNACRGHEPPLGSVLAPPLNAHNLFATARRWRGVVCSASRAHRVRRLTTSEPRPRRRHGQRHLQRQACSGVPWVQPGLRRQRPRPARDSGARGVVRRHREGARGWCYG